MIKYLNIQRNSLSRTAFAALYQRHAKYVYNVCLRMLKEKGNAEDVLQETFLQAHQKWHQLKDKQAARAWLKQIAVNKCLAILQKRKKLVSIEDLVELSTPDSLNVATISFHRINQYITGLPNGCREIFTLFCLEGYGHKEIACMLGISESTSKSQYHRAKQLLQKQLKPIIDAKR